MKIGPEEVRRVAALAGLEFDEAGARQMAAEMSRVLEYVDQLNELDLGGSLNSNEGSTSTPLRLDEVRPSTPRDEVASNAPAWAEGFFVVPQVIGNE